ncbi:hypothetical protein J3E68DRAFT_430959 [Trichoderma sp. SZMC 28012]
MAPTRRSARLNPVVQPLVDIRDDHTTQVIPESDIEDDNGIVFSPPRKRRCRERLNPIDQRLIDTRDDGRAGQTTPRKQQSIVQGVTPPDDILNDTSHIEGGEEHKDDGETVPPPLRKRRRSARLDLQLFIILQVRRIVTTLSALTVSTPNVFSQMAKDLGVSEDILNEGISWVEMFF